MNRESSLFRWNYESVRWLLISMYEMCCLFTSWISLPLFDIATRCCNVMLLVISSVFLTTHTKNFPEKYLHGEVSYPVPNLV